MTDALPAVLILAGASLGLIGAIGLHRFPDVFARMHSATKPATLGLLLVVCGAALRVDEAGDAAKLALVVALQFLTAPVGAHMVGRAAYWAGTELSPETSVDELAEVDRHGVDRFAPDDANGGG